MARGQSGIMGHPCKSKPDMRYTQERGYGDRARSHKELKDAQTRKPKASEGLALREPI